jgi:hypothetical protein
VTLSRPDGRRVSIEGFYRGGSTWQFRFAPWLLGRWTWTARLGDGVHSAEHRGSFLVVPGSSPGFVQRSPFNRYRWTFSDGRPYDPIGLQDCTVAVYTSNPLTGFGFDGIDGLPRWTSLEPYLTAYASAGFNLYRWGPNNCSFGLADRIDPSGNVYSQSGGVYADRLMSALRRHGFRVEFVLFGLKGPAFPEINLPEVGTRPARADRMVVRVDAPQVAGDRRVPRVRNAGLVHQLPEVDPRAVPVDDVADISLDGRHLGRIAGAVRERRAP